MGSPHQLAALARRLNRDAGGPPIPSLFFFSDPVRAPNPIAVARTLPRGTAVVYRHYGAADRANIARRLRALCTSRGLVLLIAADPELAWRVGADGVHWPENRLRPRDRPGLITATAHSAEAVARAVACGANACVLSPIFSTRSVGASRPLGLFGASQIARRSPLPVIALGGVKRRRAARLIGRGFAGIAAVDALTST